MHPLIDARSEDGEQGISYLSELSLSRYPFLQDHRVFDVTVFPGMAYLSILIAAAQDALDVHTVQLKDVAIASPLELEPESSHLLRLTMKPIECSYSAEFVSENANGTKQVRACGRVQALHESSHHISMDELESQHPNPVTIDAINAHFSDCGLHYGEAFRCLEEVRCGDASVLGSLRVATPETNHQSYQAHPVLLDAGLQLLAAPMLLRGNESNYIPVACAMLNFYAPLNSAVTAVLHELSGSRKHCLADLRFYSHDGRPLLELLGLNYRRVTQQTLRRALRQGREPAS